MSLKSRTHPEAGAELREAALWYESEQQGLGRTFIAAIKKAERDIVDWPTTSPVFPGWGIEPVVRSKRVQVFPYRIMYYINSDGIVLLAYAHERRRPGYWKTRLDDRV